MSSIKIAQTQNPVLEVIKNRWSPRAFSNQSISDKDLYTVFEAASWAASAMNEQPWLYLYSRKGSPGFQKIWECLASGNQPWVKNANILVIAISKTTFENNGDKNPWASHDLGMANAHLLLQAVKLGFYGHIMGGFDHQKVTETFHLATSQKPIAVIALGYLDNPETLEEPFKTRELTPRKRKDITDFVKEF